jgi:two-component system, NtrC family, sensor kinase
MSKHPIKVGIIAALLLTVAIILLMVKNLHDRINHPPLPDDGVTWVDNTQGVIAEAVRSNSAADRAGIVRGDKLLYVSFDQGQNFFTISQASDIFFILDERVGIGGKVVYTVARREPSGNLGVWDADLIDIAPEPTHLGLQVYLVIVGIVFLGIGLYVLANQTASIYALHFYFVCLTVFTIYGLSATGEYTGFDQAIYLIDSAALLALAPLFFHFCLTFPFRRDFLIRYRWILVLLYSPAMLLMALKLSIFFLSAHYPELLTWENTLKKLEVVQFSLSFFSSTILLLFTFLQMRASLLRQQLKWVVWGLALNAIPFAIFYAYPYALGYEISPLQAALATGTSILLPISFGYSIVRYRLMDVDIIVRRSMTYGLATMTIVVIFMFGVVKSGEWVKELVPSASQGTLLLIQVAVMSLTTMLFSPWKNWLEQRVDRLFFGQRYDQRRSIAEFGRTLSSTTDLNRLLTALTQRLGEMLYVERLAIYIEEEKLGGLRLAYQKELPQTPTILSDNFRHLLETNPHRSYFLAEELDDTETDFRTDINNRRIYYYIPCYVRNRLTAVIGMGKTFEGALLTSEDLELVRNLSTYVAVAIENSLLYRSEQEKAAAVARLKEFNENIIESINIGLLSVDREGRITNWNRTLEKLYKITRQSAIGQSISQVFDEDFINTIQIAVGNIGWQLRKPQNIYRYKFLARDSQEVIVNVALSPLKTNDARLSGTLILIEDITSRVRLEEQLRENDKLSSIGLLAAGVAHEVNTPLTGISSYTQMLLAQTPDTDIKHSILEKIKRQTLRASEIVNNLLNFSRTASVELHELDINRVLDDTIQLLEPQLRNTKIELKRHYGDHLPATLGNAGKLQQVFMNLLLNARDAMPEGGQLIIRTQTRESSILIDIIDTGIGIAPENITKIYDPFFTTKGIGQGTGLGLAVSYGIVQEHNGRIFVESKQGEGTRFRIKLPTANHRLQALAGD